MARQPLSKTIVARLFCSWTYIAVLLLLLLEGHAVTKAQGQNSRLYGSTPVSQLRGCLIKSSALSNAGRADSSPLVKYRMLTRYSWAARYLHLLWQMLWKPRVKAKYRVALIRHTQFWILEIYFWFLALRVSLYADRERETETHTHTPKDEIVWESSKESFTQYLNRYSQWVEENGADGQ